MKPNTTLRFEGKQVLVVGATGGLGGAYLRAFAAEGALVAAAVRDPARLQVGAQGPNAPRLVFAVDVEDPASIHTLAEQLEAALPELSVVVNATGYDVRKPLAEHTLAELDRTLDVNLRGAFLLTQALLPLLTRNAGMLVHSGGFADGRLAFPFYSADVASRAGLRSMVEAINRELAGSGALVGYFSPSPADTAAERPFHALWEKMGTPIVPVDAVAAALLNAVARRRPAAVMGGWPAVTFARLNAAFPALADLLLMRRYTAQMREFFGVGAPAQRAQSDKTPSTGLQVIAIALIVASFLLYGVGLLVVPFLALPGLDAASKTGLVALSLALGEVTFWVGAALVGSSVIRRYRAYFNPCRWFASGGSQ